jgi:coronin-7
MFREAKHSPYRHVLVTTKQAYDDVKTGNPALSNETDGFEVNKEIAAFPVSGSGGRIGLWKLNQTGRLPNKIPCIVNGSDVLDFKLDPFDPFAITTACEDGKLRSYRMDASISGLEQDMQSPVSQVSAHTNRVNLLLFHPCIRGLLVSASPERSSPCLKLWNSSTWDCLHTIELSDVALSVAFDLNGKYVAVITRDSTLSVFDLRSGKLVKKMNSHKGGKASRLFHLYHNDCWCSVGFGLYIGLIKVISARNDSLSGSTSVG